MIYKKECAEEECKKTFTTDISRQIYCCKSCAGIASKKAQDHAAEVRRRYKQMCKARLGRAFNRFVYGL